LSMTGNANNLERLRVLFVSNLYPNPVEPTRGVFNLETVRALAERSEVRVLAAVPWYPGSGSMKGIPRELNDGIAMRRYVRAFYTPGMLRNLHGAFFVRSIRKAVLDIRETFPFDVLYGSWVYPDGYGVVKLSEELGVPCVVHALGSDIHRRLGQPGRREKVLWTLRRAGHVICVSEYIRNHIVKAGVDAAHTRVIYDGVDTTLFRPRDARDARARLGLPMEARIILFVGSLLPIKGPEHLVEAFGKLRGRCDEDVRLVLVGKGSMEKELRERVRAMGLERLVSFAGAHPHEEIADWMAGADVFCLPSVDEGLPNVVLEALASGRPVVASDVGGIGEAVNHEDLGILVKPGDPEALAAALKDALGRTWETEKLTARARKFSWAEHGARIMEVLREVVTTSGG